MTETSRRGLSPLFTWRSAVCESGLPATARHVALTLSLYMNERGGSAFPGTQRLVHDTGLSERCVQIQLERLVADGWLQRVHAGGGRHRAAEYAARNPAADTPYEKPRISNPVSDDRNPASDDAKPRTTYGPRRQEDVSKTTTPSVEVANVEVDPVIAVFECWQRETGHHRASLDKKRRRVISWALAEYGLDDCLDACRGVLMFPHNRGETNGTRYDSLELIFRDAEHVERFRDRARTGPIAPKGLGGLQAVLQREQVLDVD